LHIVSGEILSSPNLPFVQYYLQELALIEDDCAEFSAAYPQVAGNLGMNSEGATDPHVKQLIESVAFIAARLKRQNDSVPGELAFSLLQSIAPHLIAPLPSMSVAKFFPLSGNMEAMGSIPVDHLKLRAGAPTGDCIFTPYTQGIRLWPFILDCFLAGSADASGKNRRAVPGFNDSNGFVLRVEHPIRKMPQHAPGDLTFFISGALNRALAAVEAMMLGVREIKMVALDGSWSVPIALSNLDVLGFEPSHRIISSVQGVSHAGALALEAMTFPRRFFFLKVSGLRCPIPSTGFFLVMVMERSQLAALDAVKQNIHLNCVPIVNVFSQQSVALDLRDHRAEYRIPRFDTGQGKWDVCAIDRVRLIERDQEHEVAEYHSGVPGHALYSHHLFWQGVRHERISSNLAHASLAVRFIGLDRMRAAGRELNMAMLDLVCSNCEAPENLQVGQALDLSGWDPGYRAALELAPTAYVPPLLSSATTTNEIIRILQWRSAAGGGLTAAVREYLTIHNRTQTPYATAAVSSLQDIRREIIAIPWTGMTSGPAMGMGCRYLISLRRGEELLGSRYLFARMIRHILAQMHDLQMPLEVLFEGANGAWVHVQ
jgi:type VI secretion system protein ImpG